MADAVQFEVKNLSEVLKVFEELSVKAQRSALRKAARAAVKPIIQDARTKAPKRTGKAAKSIHASIKGTNGKVEAKIGPRPKYFYLQFHELGTSKMSARPFLRPALDGNAQNATRAFGEAFADEVQRRGAAEGIADEFEVEG